MPQPPTPTIVAALRWGATDYREAIRWQAARAAAVADGSAPETVLFLEHHAVYTMGRRGGREHLLRPEFALGAEVIDADRGGDITFHGPGQLVVYPILRLRERGIGIARYVRLLEQAMIETAAVLGVRAERRRGQPGCWAEGRKLGSVGVRLSHGVSTHGLALNVCTELNWFDAITPCGIAGAQITSLSQELGRSVSVDEAAEAMRAAFNDIFALRLAFPTRLSTAARP